MWVFNGQKKARAKTRAVFSLLFDYDNASLKPTLVLCEPETSTELVVPSSSVTVTVPRPATTLPRSVALAKAPEG
jgi:hypothetical protein